MSDKTPDQLEQELNATRERLGRNIKQLQDYVRPGNILKRNFARITDTFKSEDGQTPKQRASDLGSTILGFFGLATKGDKGNSEG